MKPILVKTLRSRWFTTSVHVGLWVLLYLAIKGLGGHAPGFRETTLVSAPPQIPQPLIQLKNLFLSRNGAAVAADTNGASAFFTKYFIPPPAPAPPPPTTRKIELIYVGFYETEGQPKHSIVKQGDAFLVSPLGAKVTANLFAAEATMQSLTLTNPAAQTNLLLLNVKKELEVPLQ